jgi:hypothetical protein
MSQHPKARKRSKKKDDCLSLKNDSSPPSPLTESNGVGRSRAGEVTQLLKRFFLYDDLMK